MNQDIIQEFELTFFEDGKKLAMQHLSSGINHPSILALTKAVYSYIDAFLESFQDYVQAEQSTVDCQKGCHWCCFQTVMTVPHEMYYLLHHLNQHFTEEAKQAFFDKVEQRHVKTSKLKVNHFLSLKHACPFLGEEGNCTVYEARPLACRTYLSSNVHSCKSQFDHPDDQSVFAAAFDLPLRLGRMLTDGVTAYLQERDINSYEWLFEQNLLRAHREGSFDEWIQGKEVFKPRALSREEEAYLQKHFA